MVDTSRRDGSRLGFFAALYRRVTIEVKRGIDSGRFEDGTRMDRFDVIFATRYLEALERFRRGDHPGDCWSVAFRSAPRWRLLILQHLLLGMNAHINLDLGIAAAQTCPGEQLPALRRDFDEISNILAELVDEVQDKIGAVSPWLGLLDRVGGRTDEAIVNFSMQRARDAAWELAEKLAVLDADQQGPEIANRDRAMALFARGIRTPGITGSLAALAIRLRESNDVRGIIEALA